MNYIIFSVNVPVLSVNRYLILPNYSGIVVVLAIVSGIYLSWFILYECAILAKSKFTLKLIGIIEDNNKVNLKTFKYQYF